MPSDSRPEIMVQQTTGILKTMFRQGMRSAELVNSSIPIAGIYPILKLREYRRVRLAGNPPWLQHSHCYPSAKNRPSIERMLIELAALSPSPTPIRESIRASIPQAR